MAFKKALGIRSEYKADVNNAGEPWIKPIEKTV
jgi:hypothetical protein